MAKKKTNAEKLSIAYLKAYKRFSELKKLGYVFDKRMEKMFSAESFQQKSLKPTKKNIERYKNITKNDLYKKAKGFYDIDSNKMISVSAGKKLVNARRTKKKEVSNMRVELFNKLNEIDSKYFDVTEQKNEVLNNFSSFVANGGQVTKALITRISEKIDIITFDSKQDHVNDAFDSINSMLTGGESYSDGGDVELIGTPYESM